MNQERVVQVPNSTPTLLKVNGQNEGKNKVTIREFKS